MEDNTETVKQIENKSDKYWLWKKGETGNPNGRPKKGQTLTDIAKEILEEELPTGMSRKEALMRKMVTLAFDGNETMMKLLWNYIDGVPVQKMEHGGTIDHRHISYSDALKILRGEEIDEPITVQEPEILN